jgi:hypothetical protein
MQVHGTSTRYTDRLLYCRHHHPCTWKLEEIALVDFLLNAPFSMHSIIYPRSYCHLPEKIACHMCLWHCRARLSKTYAHQREQNNPAWAGISTASVIKNRNTPPIMLSVVRSLLIPPNSRPNPDHPISAIQESFSSAPMSEGPLFSSQPPPELVVFFFVVLSFF